MFLKIKVPIILFLLVLFQISCQNKTNENKVISNHKNKVDSIYTMQPLTVSWPDLNKDKKQIISNTISQFYEEKFVSNDFSGSILVAKNGHIIFEKYRGMSNFEEKRSINANTPLHIASLSKVITATAILLLVDSKKITLDQKVNTILDDFPYPEITIRTLLNHRSGLRNYSYFTDKKAIWDQKNTLQNSDLIPIINQNNIDLEYKTDTHFSYCNTNYAFLALIIEKIMKVSYAEALEKIIFKPLQMNSTFFLIWLKIKIQ